MAEKNLYLTKIQLRAELERCLNCKSQPCMNACPVNCNPREFINFAKQGDMAQAVKTICRNNPMGQTCGLICHDKFCMKACTRRNIDFSVNIPKVQATILENYQQPRENYACISPNGKKVAVIGAGPAGIAATSVLAKTGSLVTLFEASEQIGGALNMIPPERLPHEVIERDWSFLANDRLISLRLNTRVQNPLELLDEYDGIIVATGEPNCINLNIPGEEFAIPYIEYLYNPQKYKTSGNVAIIGGGNVAADCAFTATTGGAKMVEMFVRRRLSDMRIYKNEYLELLKRQVNISSLTSPDKIIQKNGNLSLFVHKNYFDGEKWLPIPNTSIELPGYSLIVKAVGSRADLKVTNEKIIYAGDCKTGGSTIVEAIASGRAAAYSLNEILL